MPWADTVIWWHCYPLRFVDAERERIDTLGDRVEHRLPRLTAWLDYVIELGTNGLILAPVFVLIALGESIIDLSLPLARQATAIRPGELVAVGVCFVVVCLLAFGTLAILAAAAYPAAELLRIGERLSFVGALIEVLQSIPVLHRDCEAMDWVADTVVIVGVLAIVHLARRARPSVR